MSMERKKKVLCPLEGKNGRTYWMRIGNAYLNSDGSTNVWLNAYPANGRLQIRDLDERDLERSNRTPDAASLPAPAPASASASASEASAQDIPF